MNRASSNTSITFSRRFLLASTALVAAGAMAIMPTAAKAVDPNATPQGGNVTGGSATISNPSVGRVEIDQTTDRVFIDWDSFNIGENASTEFFQPGTDSLAVNKVVGPNDDPTQILGSLKANGQVMVLDRNGVFFGENARIDVGGIIASTGDVDKEAIMNGADVIEFTNLGDATIENRGQISVAQAGIAAFVAPTVKNSGVINAKLGKVAFAAGEKVTLDLYGDSLVEIAASDELEDALLENAGTINAQGGRVVMTARAAKDAVDSVINMSGVINASSVSQQGGTIILSGGDNGAVEVTGTLEADGTDGGEIDVRGESITVAETAKISADGVEQGGNIEIIGSEELFYHGASSAEGGVSGGFIETSAPYILVDGTFKVGEGGEVLIDPIDLCVFGAGGVCDFGSSVDFIASIRPTLIGGGTVTTTNAPGSGQGDIEIVGDLSDGGFTSTSRGTWNITANDDVFFRNGSNLVVDGEGLNLNLTSLEGVDGLTPYLASLEGNVTINTGGGDVTVNAPSFQTFAGSTIDAAGGNIVINNTEALVAVVAESLITSGEGTIEVNQYEGGSIQTAIDAIDNSGTGTNTINVAAGDYNESVNADEDNLVLKGANAGKAGNDLSRGSESTINPNSPGVFVTADNVTIDGFEIEGGEIGVHVRNASNVVIENNNIHGQRHPFATGTQKGFRGSGDGILVSHGSSNVEISGNYIFDTDDEAIQAVDSSDVVVEYNLLDNSELLTSNGHEAINFTDITGDSFIRNNTIFSGFASGIGIYDSAGVTVGGSDEEANTVTGQLASGGTDIGIYITNSTDTYVAHNIIRSSGSQGIYVDGADDTTLEANSIVWTGDSGILVNPSAGAVITGNEIDATGSHGIEVVDSEGAEIIENEIGLNDDLGTINGDGIRTLRSDLATIYLNEITNTESPAFNVGSGIQVIAGDGSFVEENVIYDVAWDGVRIQSANDVEVLGNEIDDVQRSGIFGGTVNDLLVEGNFIETAEEFYGVHLSYGNNNQIFGNTIDDTNLNGIYANNNGTGLEITGNFVGTETGNIGQNGIEVYLSADALVDFNEVNDTGANGIYVNSSTGAIVDNNLVTNAGLNGVLVNPSDDVDVTFNTIDTVGGDGIRVEGGTGHNITENFIYDSAFDGIHVEGFGTTWISYNTIDGTGDDGIEVVDGEYVSIYENTVLKAGFYADNADGYGADGIHVRDVTEYTGPVLILGVGVDKAFSPADVDVYENTIAFTMDDGIEVIGDNDGETAYVYGNTVGHIGYEAPLLGTIGGDYIGIKLDGITESEVYGNVISSIVDDGIKVINGAYTGIYDNRIALVGGDGIEVDDVFGGRDDDSVPFIIGEPTDYTGEGSVEITYNEIAVTGENGIYVHESGATRIIGNDVFMAGVGEAVAEEVNATAAIIAGDFIPPFAAVQLIEEIIIDDEPSFDLEWGSGDGILVQNVYGEDGGIYQGPGLIVDPVEPAPEAGYSVVIQSNTVEYTGGDGIEVDGSDRVLIGGESDEEANYVYQAGIEETTISFADSFTELFTTGPFAPGNGREDLWVSEGNDWSGEDLSDIISEHVVIEDIDHDTHDGIRVSNVYQSFFDSPIFIGAGDYEGGEDEGGDDTNYVGYAVNIIGNTVDTTGDDGIEVVDSSSVLILDNFVYNAGYGRETDYGSGDYYGADGIHVRNIPGEGYYGYDGLETGDGFESYAVVIDGNYVDTTADDGIEVVGEFEDYDDDEVIVRSLIQEGSTGRTLITGNEVYYAGNGDVGEDGYGADGIHVRGVYNHFFNPWIITSANIGGGIGFPATEFAVEINDNDVEYTTDDGIEVVDSESALIVYNDIYDAGYGEGEYYEGGDIYGADGIHVRGVGGFSRGPVMAGYAGGESEGEFGGYAVEIYDNYINTTADDGIEVVNSLSTLIDYNEIYNAGAGRGGYYGGGDYYGADGIHVRNVPGFVGDYYDDDYDFEVSSSLGGGYYDDEFVPYAVVITDNYINTTADDGIEVVGEFEGISTNIFDGPLGAATGKTLITYNETYNNGVFYDYDDDYEGEWDYYGAPDGYGADGIHVRGVYNNFFGPRIPLLETASTAGSGYGYGETDFAVDIYDNYIDTTGDDGIEVLNSESALIEYNDVYYSGYYGEGSSLFDIYFFGNQNPGADGITVRNVGGRYYIGDRVQVASLAGGGEGDFFGGYAVEIIDNYIDTTADDGIEVSNSASVLIDDNDIYNAGSGDDYYYGGGDYYGADGIHVRNVSGGGFIGFPAGDYYDGEFEDYAVVIRNNYIDDTADDGIEVISDFEDYFYGDKVTRLGPIGPFAQTGRTLIEGNQTYNNGVFYDYDDDYEGDYEFESDWDYYGAPDGYGADGIHVRGVSDNRTVYDYSYEEGEDFYTETDTYTRGERDAVIIRGNLVDTTGDDGIEVLGLANNDFFINERAYFEEDFFGGYTRTSITGNEIYNSGYGDGYYYGGADEWGADGIHVRDVIANTSIETYTYTEYYETDSEDYDYDSDYTEDYFYNDGTSVYIAGNTIDVTEDDGIQVLNSGNSVIYDNDLYDIGYGNGYEYEGPYTIDGNGADGIHVRTGFIDYNDDDYYQDVKDWDSETPTEEYGYFLSTSTEIIENTVNVADDDGIDVEGVTDVLIADNGIYDVEDDGIEVVGYAPEFVEYGEELVFGSSEGPTEEVPSFVVDILDNYDVSGSDDNGIKVEDVNIVTIDGNNVSGSGDDGIEVDTADFITISNNDVSDSESVGVLLDGLNNGSVVLAGNTLTDNPVHARFESGEVDLTGDSNTFTNGDVGIQFDGELVSLIDNDPADEFEGTLGEQIFEDQSEFFVELSNGALFEPGQPSLYDATQSSYTLGTETIEPSLTGGIITADELDTLEEMFYHYEDDDTLGLFFLGALSIENLEDIFENFGAFNGGISGSSVTITGLPTTGPGQTPQFLNSLSPEAGEGEEPTAEELANIDPASGASDVACWSDVTNVIDSGTAVSYDFDTSFESAIADAINCGATQDQ